MLAAARDPIVAVATAPGRGAVGIVRVSGPGLAPLARALTGKTLAPRVATYGPLLAADGSPIDQGLALHFPAPHSYTGEDVLELQAHGGPVVLQLLVARCLEAAAAPRPDTGEPTLPRLRLAEPGEFTRRAFLNGKLDLTQAEAVSDLIEAGTEAAVRSAARSLQGEFSTRVKVQAEALLKLRLLVEATLDFPEEEIDFLQAADARGQLTALIGGVQAVQQQARQGALLRDGLQVVIAGQPNVGKSSLLNALAGAELAIVTPIAGTTRDRIEQAIQIEGVPLHIVDTAGLRDEGEAADDVERIGMQRTWEAVRRADVVLFLHDLTRVDDPAHQAGDARIAAALLQHGIAPAAVLHVHNKRDVANPAALTRVPADALALSARAGDGLDALRQALLQRAGWQALPEGVFMARERHLQALADTLGHLGAAQVLLTGPEPALDLLAEELRLAHTALGRITGPVSADDLLGEIFGRFCIGK